MILKSTVRGHRIRRTGRRSRSQRIQLLQLLGHLLPTRLLHRRSLPSSPLFLLNTLKSPPGDGAVINPGLGRVAELAREKERVREWWPLPTSPLIGSFS